MRVERVKVKGDVAFLDLDGGKQLRAAGGKAFLEVELGLIVGLGRQAVTIGAKQVLEVLEEGGVSYAAISADALPFKKTPLGPRVKRERGLSLLPHPSLRRRANLRSPKVGFAALQHRYVVLNQCARGVTNLDQPSSRRS